MTRPTRDVPEVPDVPDGRLEDALRDLGTSLDLEPRARSQRAAELVETVLARIEGLGGPTRSARPSRWDRRGFDGGRRLRVGVAARAAVAVLAVLAVLLAITPTRDAMASWFGIGGVRITTVDAPLPADDALADNAPADSGPAADSSLLGEPTTSPSTTLSTLDGLDVDELTSSLPFTVRVADATIAGQPLAVSIDPAVPSGLVEIRYEGFTLVELASQPGPVPVIEKILGPATTITSVTVGTRPGLWLTGEPHDVAYIRPDGELDRDSVRRAGDVLVWEDSGVTYRIEGAESLDQALAIAVSLR